MARRHLQYDNHFLSPRSRIEKPGELTETPLDGRVAFVTGGAGTICSMQTRALVRLGANACIVGRSVDKTVAAAKANGIRLIVAL